jgi:hypothetical protein
MITRIVKAFLVAVIVVALWKITGGNFSGILNGVWKFVTSIVNTGSDWLVSTGIFQSLLK